MIAILTGGLSEEREIALQSAQTISEIVGESGFETRTFILPEQLEDFLQARVDTDCAIPVFHGTWGEDGVIQGFLKTLGVPFVFSDILGHALAMDKRLTKILLATQGMPIAQDALIRSGETWPEWPQPVVVKPVANGSSFHVHLCRDADEYAAARGACQNLKMDFIIEEYVNGKEYSVGVIQNNGKTIPLPVVYIKPKTEFFDLKAKYDPSLCEEICPAPIPEELAEELQNYAILAHTTIGARHLSRSDFIVDKNSRVVFLEINTIPGFTQASLVPKTIASAELQAPQIFKEWIDEAVRESNP